MKVENREFNFVNVWEDSEGYQASVAYWNELFQIPSFNLDDRAKEVVYHVLYHDEVIALSSAQKIRLPEYNNHWFYNFRMSVMPKYRLPGLADKLCVQTISFLEQLSKTENSSVIGVITLIEGKRIQKLKRNVIYSASGLVFGGYTKNGMQIRLRYFKGAMI